MGIIRKIALVVLWCGIVSATYAQDANGSEPEIRKIEGVKYIVHQVETGHTLYAISKLYSVTVEDIMLTNPGSEDGLRIGQELLIPYKAVDKKEARKNSPKLEGQHLVHEVIAGETLYGIMKRYHVEDTELVKYNPFLVDGLKVGQSLVIPLDAIQQASAETIKPAVEDSLINHTVAEGETLFSLARTYKVNMDSILLVNPSTTLDLSVGQVVRIPKMAPKRKPFPRPEKSVISGSWLDGDSAINIGLMLPLYLAENDTIQKTRHDEQGLTIYRRSHIGLRFYQGFRLAMSELEGDSIPISLEVVDTGNDSTRVDSLLQAGVCDDMDLIVGPLYLSSLEKVIDYVGDSLPSTNIFCPVPQSNKVLLSNDFVVKTHPSTALQTRKMADYVVENHSLANIVILGGDDVNSRKLTQILKGRVDVRMSMKQPAREDSVGMYFLRDYDLDMLKSFMSVSNENIICIPSTDQVFVTDILTKLHKLVTDEAFDFKVKIFGLEKWEGFYNIDIRYMHDLNVHLVTTGFIDYYHPEMIKFIQAFRSTYGTDPEKYAMAGYDLGVYLGKIVQQYSSPVQNYLDKELHEGLTRGYDFFRTGIESGYENQFTYVVKYQNFELVRVK